MESAKSEFLEQLLKATDNDQFLDLISKNYFITNLNTYVKETGDVSIENLKEKILDLATLSQNIPEDYLELVHILFTVYIRENVTGPSIYTLYVEEEKRPLIKGEELRVRDLDPLSNKNKELQAKLLIHFEKDGEQIYAKTQFLSFFYAIEVLLENLPKSFDEKTKQFDLWRARFSILYDKQLTSNVVHLKDESLALYEKYIEYKKVNLDESSKDAKKEFAMLLIEQSHAYLNFYKYKEAKKCIKQALALLSLNLKLTGKLGRRTKYQEFDIAQLVLDVENREVEIKQKNEFYMEENKQKVMLEEDTILYEQPFITDPLGDVGKSELTVEDQVVIEAYVNYSHRTVPNDETRAEQMTPYINTCLAKSNNWLVYSKGLLLRSRNEFDKTKTKERSVLQIQALIDQFKDKEFSIGVKQQYYYCSDYPLFWQLMKELAKAYMKLGVFVSAYELLREVELYEDCILSLFLAGRSTQAEELAKEQLEKFQSPGILCLLGDIKKDTSYYTKAWEISNHKFARAMRSLARQHYFTGEYLKAIECYEEALKINRLYPDSWFTLGCAYMRMEDWKGAIYSFGVSISIDDQNAEGWSNISTCYLRQDKFKEAVVCLEQALKHNRKSWQIWENYIILCLETMKFHKAVGAVRELMRQDKFDRINVNLMLKVCDVFLKNYVAKPNLPAEEFKVSKKQLYNFFDEYTSKIAKDWQIWRLIGRIKGILQEPFSEIKELKLKEIRSLMVINWENDIDTCEKIERGLEELLKIFEKGEMSLEEKAFIKNTVKAIETCLQRTCKVQINE